MIDENSTKEQVLAAVKQNGWALYRASKELKADRDVVLAAVGLNGLALRFASKELKANREVVMKAVKQNGYALNHASEALRGDKAVLGAVQMDKQKLETICGFIAIDVSTGNDNSFGETLKGITGTDTQWYIEHIAEVNYIISNTLEYIGGQVFFNGNGFEIYIDTQKETVNGVLGDNVVVATYTTDNLGIDNYLSDRYSGYKEQ